MLQDEMNQINLAIKKLIRFSLFREQKDEKSIQINPYLPELNKRSIVDYHCASRVTMREILKTPQIMLTQKVYNCSASIFAENKLFLFGGGEGGKYALDNMVEYDFNARLLIAKASMLCKKGGHSLCSLASFVYSVGGFDSLKSIQDCQKYSIAENKWYQVSPLITPRLLCAVFVWMNSIYSLCGDNYYDKTHHLLDSMERLKLDEGKWESIEVNAPNATFEIHACPLSDGILVYGGQYFKESKLVER